MTVRWHQRLLGTVAESGLLVLIWVPRALRALLLLALGLLLLPLLLIALPGALAEWRQLGVPPPWRRWRRRCPRCGGRQLALLRGTPYLPLARFRCGLCSAILDADGTAIELPELERKGRHPDLTGFVMARLILLRQWPVGEYRERTDILASIVDPHASAFGVMRALDAMVEAGIIRPEGTGYRRVSESEWPE